jgi:hypothetical protein
MSSPTARSLALLRRGGYCAGIVERFIVQANVRKDLFGCIDLVAVKRGESGVLGVQPSNRYEVWGWAKRCPRWEVRRVALAGSDLQAAISTAPPRQGRRGRGSVSCDPFNSPGGPRE